MGFGCTAVSPPAKIRIGFVQSEELTGFGTFFCSFLVADLLGNILANLLGDRLALLSWLLPRNVAAVLHLLGDNTHLLEVFFCCCCKSLPFFYCLNFEKADCSIFALLVGRSVGWSVDVTINFFNIYRHKSPLLTQCHSIPISTKLY